MSHPASMKMATTQDSLLLDLPPEIRSMVYGYLFALHQDPLQASSHRDVEPTALLQSCRFLRSEANGEFHKFLARQELRVRRESTDTTTKLIHDEVNRDPSTGRVRQESDLHAPEWKYVRLDVIREIKKQQVREALAHINRLERTCRARRLRPGTAVHGMLVRPLATIRVAPRYRRLQEDLVRQVRKQWG